MQKSRRKNESETRVSEKEKGWGERERRTLNGHKEGLVEVTDGGVKPLVTVLHEFLNLVLSDLLVAALEGGETGSHDDRGVLAVELVLGEEVAHLHLDELEHLRVVNLIDLVDEDDKLLDANLAGKEEVLPSLGHLSVGGSDNDDSGVELSGTSNHVLNVWGGK